MVLSKTIATCIIFVFLIGCTSVSHKESVKSYKLGQQLSAPVGGVFLTDQDGHISERKEWVGLLHSSNGYEVHKVASSDYIRKELVYGGITGTVIEIAYREYRGGMAAASFFQNVKYDLADSNIIVFQNFQFSVLDATNSGIQVVLKSDGSN